MASHETTAPSAVKERPILFSGPMVRALLAGTKTQTRRAMKPQPVYNGESVGGDLLCHNDYLPPDALLWKQDSVVGYDAERLCPYGQAGERLWVRETGTIGRDGGRKPITWAYGRNPGACERCMHPEAPAGSDNWCLFWRAVPSIHMPRWACRIVLELTDVRAQALHEITETDAAAEGIESCGAAGCGLRDGSMFASCRIAYSRLWDDINGAGAWDANPWVWALTFRRVGA